MTPLDLPALGVEVGGGSDLGQIRKALQDAGVFGVEQRAASVAAMPNGLARLLLTIAAKATDPNVRNLPAVVSALIDQGRLLEADDPRVAKRERRRADVDNLDEQGRRAMFPGYAIRQRTMEEDPRHDPVGTRYYRASDAFKGVQDPPCWAIRSEEGVETLIGAKGVEGNVAPSDGNLPEYRFQFTPQERAKALALAKEAIR